MKTRIAILTKDPVPGRVKTRLIPAIGAARAAALHEEMALATVTRAQATGLRVVVYLDGRVEGRFATKLRELGCSVRPQALGSLGARIADTLTGTGRRIVMGTDCPIFSPAWVLAAATSMHPLAFGAAEDGGFWILSADCERFRQVGAALFSDIEWSSTSTLDQCLARAGQFGIDVAALPACYDIDLPPALSRLIRDPRCPPRIRAFLLTFHEPSIHAPPHRIS